MASYHYSVLGKKRRAGGLHLDGIVGVADDVPTGIFVDVGKQGAGARNVFFRMNFIDLVFSFVALVGNGEHADAVDRRVGDAESRNGKAEVIPGEVDGIRDEEEGGENGSKSSEESNSGRGWGGWRHKSRVRGIVP